MAPTIALHLESYHEMKSRPTDDHDQNNFGTYKHLVEQEIQNHELCNFLSIGRRTLSKD